MKERSTSQERSDLRMKQIAFASLIVSLLILSIVSVTSISSNHVGLKKSIASPIRQSLPTQYEISEPLVISSNTDFALFGATGAGTPSDPYTFEYLQISSNETCIRVSDTTAYFVLSNCRFESNATYGAVWFDNVENGRVEECEFIGTESGIYFSESNDCSVVNNTIYNCWNGVNFQLASNCSVINNKIHNSNRGVLLEHTTHCDIINNSIYSNLVYGVDVGFLSNNNTVYGNSIGWNGQRNAIDMGENNTFDNGISIGNRWSDYNESETYVIPGTGLSIDEYAQLLDDTTNPIIVPAYDVAIDVDSVGNVLSWTTGDEFPDLYFIEQDSVQVILAVWSENEITFSLDHLRQGPHTITLTVYDGAGNVASDDVFVSVVSFILGGIGTELVMIASGATVVFFVLIIIVIKRMS